MMIRTAEFSPCRTWRYSLSRIWAPSKSNTIFIGLNPSTANETEDDPTIRRCMRFAHGWGCGGMVMLNLFAYRSKDPKMLRLVKDPIGPRNDEYLLKWIKSEKTQIVVASWGADKSAWGRDCKVMNLLKGSFVRCLGTTKEGHPKHPLYLKKDTQPVPFEVPA